MRLGVSMPVLEFLAEILLRGMVIIKRLAAFIGNLCGRNPAEAETNQWG